MEHFLLILGIIWLAVISPGADFAMVSRLSCVEGQRAGVLAAFGIAIGCWFHIAYAIFGLAIVARLFPHLLEVVRIAGAAYLCYLGLTMVFAKAQAASAPVEADPRGGSKALRTGILTNALNPKASVFVVSLYAQVIGRDTSLIVRLGYGVAISASHLLWFATVAIFLSRPSIRAYVLAHRRAADTGIGAILIALGLTLAFTN